MSATRRLEYISRYAASGAVASVSFTPLSTDFRKFFFVMYVVNDANASGLQLVLNNDTAGNYSEQRLSGDGGTVSAARSTSRSNLQIPNGGPAANVVALTVGEISKPAAAEVARVTTRSAYNTATIAYEALVGEWTDTSALISRIDFTKASGNFAAGTTILLYGSRD